MKTSKRLTYALKSAVNIADLRLLAKRRLPRVIFDFLDGASEDERALALNLKRLREYSLVPRVLRGAAQRDQSVELFGTTYSSFFGISPTGFVSLLRRDIELMLAGAAQRANIPMILSGVSAEPIETVAAKAPNHIWSQLYAAKDSEIDADLVRRAQDSGVSVLVWTVDRGAAPKNDRLIRNGIGFPPRVGLMNKLEALTHPKWMLEYLRGDMMKLESWQPYVAAYASVTTDASPFRAQKLFIEQRSESLTWRRLETLRQLWTGPLVVKGILHPDDAVRVAELGGDGVIVSNHGGYGLDRAPAAIDMLPDVVAAVGEKLTVMFDGGVRRGSDVVVARCLGARFVFVGRATLYGVVAGGMPGALHAIDILEDEIDRTMGQIGCSSGDELNPKLVRN